MHKSKFRIYFLKMCKHTHTHTTGMPENTRGIQTHTASLHLCQCDQMSSIAHCMGCWIRIKSFLGCHWGGGRSPSDTINLVVRLDATADKQLNPFLPECLCHTAVMFNDKAACCFQRPCMIVTKGGLKDVVFSPWWHQTYPCAPCLSSARKSKLPYESCPDLNCSWRPTESAHCVVLHRQVIYV